MTLSIERSTADHQPNEPRRDIAEEIEGLPSEEEYDPPYQQIGKGAMNAVNALRPVPVELQYTDNPNIQLGDVR